MIHLHELDPHGEAPDSILANLELLLVPLNVIRAVVGKPIKITSGFRTRERNRAAGGALHSMHLEGLAADMRVVRDPDPTDLHETILRLIREKKIPDGGVGLYPRSASRPRGRVHYDLGRGGRRWTVR